MQKRQKEPRAPIRTLGRAKELNPKSSGLNSQRLSNKKKALIILGVLFGLGILSYILFFSNKKDDGVPISPTTLTSKSQPGQKIYSPLSGAEVTEEQANRALTALIIENSVDARPQSGLTEAGVIYEAIAEGGITRFAAIYQENTPQEIGPVRSLRPYFLDWLRPFDPTIAHVGGSKKALTQVRDGTWKDMDQFANGKSFWRTKDRKAPHNVYTSFENIYAFNKSKKYVLEEFTQFPRKEDQPSSSPSATTINMNISSKMYNSSLTYNSANNSYLRSQGGAAHLDKSGKQLEPKVVIALISSYSIVQEDGSRSAYKTSGTGEAIVFQDGTATPATWKKTDQKAQIELTDSSGSEIKLNRGQTWFTVLSSKDKLSYK